MFFMRIGLTMAGWFLSVLGCMGQTGLASDSGANQKPSVLLLVAAEQRLDFKFLNALHARGFQLDYCGAAVWSKESVAGTLPERLRRYNVVVMVQAGESDTFFDRAGMAQFVKSLAQYADEGGGLLLMPNTITWDIDWNYPEFARLSLETFGASYLLSQWILDANPDNNAQGGLHTVN